MADRDRVVVILKDALIAGRLTTDEFKQRVERAAGALDFSELLSLMADLPVRGPFDRLPAHRISPRPAVRGWRSWRWLGRVCVRSGPR